MEEHPTRPSREVLAPQNSDFRDGKDCEAARREVIATAIREWIIPTLVRRFMTERTSDGQPSQGTMTHTTHEI